SAWVDYVARAQRRPPPFGGVARAPPGLKPLTGGPTRFLGTRTRVRPPENKPPRREPSSRRAETVTPTSPAGVNLMALAKRLTRTCRNRAASPTTSLGIASSSV